MLAILFDMEKFYDNIGITKLIGKAQEVDPSTAGARSKYLQQRKWDQHKYHYPEKIRCFVWKECTVEGSSRELARLSFGRAPF